MKHWVWIFVCCMLMVGCQPPANSGTGAGTTGGSGASEAGESNATDGAALDMPEAATNVSVVKFEVPGMSCPLGCAPAVAATLKAQPGVADCNVEFESKIATCEVTADFDAEKALAALQSNEQFASSKLVK